MNHTFQKGNNGHTLILLHGTGGNEHDLISLGKALDLNANLLGIRGNLSESGMNRFFKRFGMGSYDLESFKNESISLANFIQKLSKDYKFDLTKTTLVGFSNGANIMQGLLQHTDLIVAQYAFLSPAYIQKDKAFQTKVNHIFIATSDRDPYVKADEIHALIEKLKSTQAHISVLEHTGGHHLTQEVFQELQKWYLSTKSAT